MVAVKNPQWSVQGPHPTSGLAGYPARDYIAPAGTGVYAWAPLQVVRISGQSGSRGPGFGGWNVYLKDRSGRQYFMTHVEGAPGKYAPLGLRVGEVLRPGQLMAYVGNYPGMRNHVHIGYQGGDPVDTLGLGPNYIFSAQGAASGSTAVQQSISRQATQPQGGYHGPLADVPVLGSAGRTTVRGLDWLLSPVDKTIAVAKAPFNAIEWAGKNWDRVLQVGGGFILMLVGLLLIGKSVGMQKPNTVIVGDLANRVNFGPEVTQARSENLRRGTSHDVSGASDTLPRRSSQGATTPSGDDIPY